METARNLTCFALLIGLYGCDSSSAGSARLRGRDVYVSSCISCHNADPSLSGPLGPEIRGSSRELIEARVLRAEYPPGYQPKRNTRQMVPLPQLAPYIDDLAEYLK